MVGTVGSTALRLSAVVAMGRTLPRLDIADLRADRVQHVVQAARPASPSSPAPAPLYGTAPALMPASRLNFSTAGCEELPHRGHAVVQLARIGPLAASTSAFSVLTLDEDSGTTTTLSKVASSVIG